MKCPKCDSENIEEKYPQNFDEKILYCADCGHVLSGRIEINNEYYADVVGGTGITLKTGHSIEWMITPHAAGEVPEEVRTIAVLDDEVYFSEMIVGCLGDALKAYENHPEKFITDGKNVFIHGQWFIDEVPELSEYILNLRESILNHKKLH